jgi:hypothetical protein
MEHMDTGKGLLAGAKRRIATAGTKRTIRDNLSISPKKPVKQQTSSQMALVNTNSTTWDYETVKNVIE